MKKLDEMNMKQREVIQGIEVLATSFDQTASEQALNSWYKHIDSLLESEAQKTAFESGAVALLYGIGDMKLRERHYSNRFHRLLRKVEA